MTVGTSFNNESSSAAPANQRSGGGVLAQLWGASAARLVDRIDRGLVAGTLHATLPDGSTRMLGGRAPGFEATVTLHAWGGLVRVARAGSVGLCQAWEAGEWSSPNPVQLFALFVANADALGGLARAHGPWRWAARLMHWLHRNTRRGSQRNIHAHYDLGNDFYAAWLDPELIYSSARYAVPGQDLAMAQQHKLAAIAQRLGGAKTVLEIGCGWGALAQYLHDQGMQVTAISLSDAQLDWARQRRSAQIDFRKQDYRDVSGQFDAIASVEMVEAVGREYWPAYFACLARCLTPGGRAAIQYIAIRDELFPAYVRSADFIQTYIFPGGMLVSEAEFRRLAAEHALDWRDQQDFALDYAETLKTWRENFDRAIAEGRLPPHFDARFQRLWRFYLMYCEGGFRGGGITVAQVTLVKS
ncbi:MAG: class I SAM-dependent methyltransferase [Sphingomonadales bacterium]|nr:class I SAM-dependent methyltransferase [Sphingomonadaceae bacterium]MBS3931526.1 class I SAM-dependent methyltransferase [Sphingomonadales bacterium]